MLNKSQKTKLGFSLAELLIVMAIISVMTAVILTKSNNNKTTVDAEAAARLVAAQLRSLQNESLNGKQIGSVSVCSFKFHIDNGASNYLISYYGDCTDSASSLIGSAQSLKLSGKNNVKAASGNDFYFKSPQGGISTGTQRIVLSSSDNSASATVCVYPTGNIVEKKGAAGC